MNKFDWLQIVYQTIKDNPEWIGDTVASCNEGLTQAFSELLEAKTDIEAALGFAVRNEYKKSRDKFIKNKLLAAKKYLSFNWDWFFEEKK